MTLVRPAKRLLQLVLATWATLATSQAMPPGVSLATPAAATPAASAPTAAASAPRPTGAAATGGPQAIVVTGRAADEAEQRRLAVAGISVVGRDELDAYGDNSVLDVLQRQAGISVDGDAPRLRGLGEGYTVVLINGEPAPPGFAMDSLAPADIERIEITKGPTAEHGGAAGVINIILRVPPKLRQREVRLALGYRAVRPEGSGSISWGDRLGEGAQTLGFHLPLSVVRWANAGALSVQRSNRSPTAGISAQHLQGDDQWLGQGLSFGPRIDWKRNAHESLQLQLFVQANQSDNRGWRQTQVLLPAPLPNTTTEDNQNAGSWQMQRAQLQWLRRWDTGTRLELKLGAESTRAQNDGQSRSFNDPGAPMALRQSHSDNRETRLNLGGRWRWPLGEQHTLVLGGDFSRQRREELRQLFENGSERISGSLGMPFEAEQQRSQLFLQDEWAAGGGFSALAGLRLEHLRMRSADRNQRFLNTSTTLAPVLNLRHALDGPGKRLLRLGLARSLRLPGLSTLMPRYNLNGGYERQLTNTPLAADSAGNPQLKPERADGVDLAIEQHLAAGGVLSASVFHRQISGLIRRRTALEQDADAAVPAGVARWVSRPANFGRARSSGLELELKGSAQQLLPTAWVADWPGAKQWRLRAALSVYRSKVELLDDPEARLEGQPPWQASLGADRPAGGQQAPGLGIGASYTHVPAFATQQTDLQRIWRSRASRLDAYVLWRIDRQLQLRLAGQSLLAMPQQSSSLVQDLDGFGSQSSSQRSTARQWTAQLTWRF